ncbi:MAG TPA: oligopeptide/dipeptide ABC transporter ATP-binding protein [Ilumatobacter sp.]|nr:oligopeptide/dipeptide ABC transporter ATP-binding protein [Ilumatobacter sp.]
MNNVSLHVHAGETLGLLGESGSGKSTAARLLTRLIEPDSGSIRIEGADFLALRGRALRHQRRSIQMVFQDPYSSLDPTKMVVHAVGEPLTIHAGLRGKERDQRVATLLEQVGLSARHVHRYPYEFSGGQRQRIAIARALAPDPSILIADEAVSSLDVSTQAQVLNLLIELREARGLAMLFISHDLGVVRQVADRVAVMYLGEIVETGTCDDIYHAPQHPYTRALLAAVPEIDPARRRPRVLTTGEVNSVVDSGCTFRARCPEAIDICAVSAPEPRAVGSTIVACHLHRQAPTTNAQTSQTSQVS